MTAIVWIHMGPLGHGTMRKLRAVLPGDTLMFTDESTGDKVALDLALGPPVTTV